MCAGDGTVRRIAEVFEAEGIAPAEDYAGPESGARRFEAARHEAALDLSGEEDHPRLLCVYVEAIAEFGRDDGGKLTSSAKALVQSLVNDGLPLDASGILSQALPPPPAVTLDLGDHKLLARPEVMRGHLWRINAGVRDDPAATIASCKELLESTCKFVLDDYQVAYGAQDDLLSLYKRAAGTLKLNAESVPDSAKGSQAAQRALRSMSAVVQALAELRNELGLGHGRTVASQALARHARLTAALTTGVVQFLLDTWHVRREGEVA